MEGSSARDTHSGVLCIEIVFNDTSLDELMEVSSIERRCSFHNGVE